MKDVYAKALLLTFLLLIGATNAPAKGSQESRNEIHPKQGSPLLLGTLNVHYVAEGQERLDWENRKEAVAAAIQESSPDIIAFQEMETFEGGHFNTRNVQLAFLREQFPAYAFAAVGDPREYPSTQPVMYRKSRFQLLEQGFFFFSPTPDNIYSDPWDGRYPAFCSWVRFRENGGGATFYLYNVHFDYESRENRLRSAKLVTARIASRAHQDSGVLVVGDFNAPWFFRPVQIVAGSQLHIADTTGSTVHFYRGINIIPAIDHVLYSQEFEHQETRVLRSRFRGTWPSDHYPVFVTLVFDPRPQ